MKKIMFVLIIATSLLFTIMSPSLAESVLTSDNSDEENTADASLELTLEEAIEITLEDSSAIEQAKIELEKSEIEYDEGKLFIRKNEDDYGEDSAAYLEQIAKNKIVNNLSWEIAQREYKDTIDEQIREVEEKYFDVLHAQKNVEIYEENLKLAGELYEKTKKEFEVGKVTELEVTSSELNYEKTLKELAEDENELQSLKMELNILLGFDVMEDIVLTDELEVKTFEEVDITEAINTALENDVDLLDAQLSYEAAIINMEVTSRTYPEITFEYREKAVELKEAEESLESVKKTVEKNVREKYSAVIQNQEGIHTTQKSVEYAQMVLDATTLSYDVGLKILTDVQEAQIDVLTEELTLAQDILDYNIAILEFEESLGNEIEE